MITRTCGISSNIKTLVCLKEWRKLSVHSLEPSRFHVVLFAHAQKLNVGTTFSCTEVIQYISKHDLTCKNCYHMLHLGDEITTIMSGIRIS